MKQHKFMLLGLLFFLPLLFITSCDDLINPETIEVPSITDKDKPNKNLIFDELERKDITNPKQEKEKDETIVEKLKKLKEKNPNGIKDKSFDNEDLNKLLEDTKPKYLTPNEEKELLKIMKGDYEVKVVVIPDYAGAVNIPTMLKDKQQARLSAVPNTGYDFLGWFDKDGKTLITDELNFMFSGNKGEDREYVAKFTSKKTFINLHLYTVDHSFTHGDYFYFRLETTEEVKSDLKFEFEYIVDVAGKKFNILTFLTEPLVFTIRKGQKHSNYVKFFFNDRKALFEDYMSKLFPMNYEKDYYKKIVNGRRYVYELGVTKKTIQPEEMKEYGLDIDIPVYDKSKIRFKEDSEL